MSIKSAFSDFGVVGDGITDDTEAFQEAVAACSTNSDALDVTDLDIRLTDTITTTKPLRFFGHGSEPFVGNLPSQGAGTRGGGSWLFFDHDGAGLHFDGNTSNSAAYGCVMQGVGTRRDQPIPEDPAAPFAPIERDFDIVLGNMDLLLSDVCLLNPYKAIRTVGVANWTKLKMRNVKGQPIHTGAQVELAGDFFELQFHWWPYWSNDPRVRSWVRNNGRALVMGRADNPTLTNSFALGYRHNILFDDFGLGAVSKLRVSQCDFDWGGSLLHICDNRVGDTVQFSNVSWLGADASGIPAAFNAIELRGGNARIEVENYVLNRCPANIVRALVGSGNVVSMGNGRIDGWNRDGAGFPAFEIGAGNTLNMAGPVTSNSQITYSGSGVIRRPPPFTGGGNPANNQDVSFGLSGNNSLIVKVRGNDGVIRSATIPLA